MTIDDAVDVSTTTHDHSPNGTDAILTVARNSMSAQYLAHRLDDQHRPDREWSMDVTGRDGYELKGRLGSLVDGANGMSENAEFTFSFEVAALTEAMYDPAS